MDQKEFGSRKAHIKENQSSDITLHGPGRPRRVDSKNSTGKSMRTSLIVNRDTYDKMRAIAVKEGLTLKEVIDSAFRLAIERYETKNGSIKSAMGEVRREELFK